MTSTLQVNEDVVTLLGWPTDTVQIQHPTIQQQQQQQQRQQDRDETVLPSRSSETNPDTNDNKNKSNNKYYQTPHTILIFVPGNPGCIGWYKSTLSTLVERLGPGVVAYGVSYAGHSPHPSQTKIHIEEKEEENNEQQQQKKKRNPNKQSLRPIQVAWTIEGQVQHKIAFYDYIMMKLMMVNPKEEEDESHRNQQQKQSKLPKIIWLSHSIGGHLVERVLVLRKDIMKQTMGVLHIMPFIRMKAERLIDQWILDFGAGRTQWIISTTQRLLQTANGIHQRLDWFRQYLPKSIHSMISPTMIMMDDPKDQQLAIALLSQPWFVQNFFQLGMEELRDVSEIIDVSFSSTPILWLLLFFVFFEFLWGSCVAAVLVM